jgi:predicted 2-oxoglutarate/Fe(II)-dependent dioxygenase YbiX
MFVKLIENFLTKNECDNLIEFGLNSNLQKMTSVKVVNGLVIEDAVINEYTNKRLGSYFLSNELNDTKFNNINERIINILNKLKIYNNVVYTSIPKYTFNQYNVGDFLTIHQDSHETKYGATTTVLIQLNDDYDGGDFIYVMNGIEYIVPKIKGSIFIFDSNINHLVTKVKSGIRYSINVWPTSIKKVNLL